MTASQPTMFHIEANRYKMLAIHVTRNSGLTLSEAMSLTLVEAWLTLGAKINGN